MSAPSVILQPSDCCCSLLHTRHLALTRLFDRPCLSLWQLPIRPFGVHYKVSNINKLGRCNLKSSIRERRVACRAISSNEPAYEKQKFSHLITVKDSLSQSPVALLWLALGLLVWCTQRAGGKVQCAAFLLAEAVYIWLHIKPLVPLLASLPVPAEPDIAFLQNFTTGGYFATELALFWLLAFASPIRSVVPRVVLAIHAAFHTLYTLLATFARRWCLQQNIQRLQAQARKGQLSWRSLWDTALNVLNGADAALHIWYFVLLAAALQR